MEKKRKTKKWIARLAIGELGRSKLEVNLYNRRALTEKQRKENYQEIIIMY